MRTLIASILFLGTIVSATAQDMQQVATDQELQAAYCVGALIDSRDPIEQQTRERLRSYLAARGMLTVVRGPVATNGINLAAQRGNADAKACEPHEKSCTIDCQRQGNATTRCVASCALKNPACGRTYRCLDGNPQLPF